MCNILYYLYQYWYDIQDPRTKHLPLIDYSPLPITFILITYYLLVTKFIPKFMENRKPYKLKLAMFLYNILMVGFNGFFFCEIIKRFDYGRILLKFEYPTDKTLTPQISQEIRLGYLYFLSKFVDLIDTFFFALRKKSSHISILHLYHHISVPVFGWLLLKINPMIPGFYLFAVLNTFIHVIMYSYYALSAFGPEIQKYLWWKRYITQLQLTQFIIFGIYGVVMIFMQRGYPMFWCLVGLPQPLFFWYMFYDFYTKSYDKRPKVN